jgi:hypothetical protein
LLSRELRKEGLEVVDCQKSVATAKSHTVLNDTVSASMLVLAVEKDANVRDARTRR